LSKQPFLLATTAVSLPNLIRISDKSIHGSQRYLFPVTAQTGEKGLSLRVVRVERVVTMKHIKCSLGGT